MAGSGKKIIVDAYAVIADLLGQVPSAAFERLEDLRKGRVTGVIHYLTIFELAYHWRRGRLPFRDELELLDFVSTYFRIAPLTPELAIASAKIKVVGDKFLREAEDRSLTGRRLSVADATTIAIAQMWKAPIISGDRDLTYVARRMGIEVVW